MAIALLTVLLRQIYGRKPVYLLDLHCFQPPERYYRRQRRLCCLSITQHKFAVVLSTSCIAKFLLCAACKFLDTLAWQLSLC